MMLKFLSLFITCIPFLAFAQSANLTFEAFGDVAVYGDPGKARHLAIILLEKSIPDDARAAIGQAAAGTDALAAVIDVERYTANMAEHPEPCTYHSWEFEKLSKYIQMTMKIPRYEPPLLAGLGTGAALAYTTAAEAPRGTFAGLFTSGICGTFAMPKPLCANEGETWSKTKSADIASLKSTSGSVGPWTVLPSTLSSECKLQAENGFYDKTADVKILSSENIARNAPEWRIRVGDDINKAMAALPAAPALEQAIADLPLEVQEAPIPSRNAFAVIFTGDGGWAGIDREVADNLNAAGVNVVGLNSLQYYWRKRTPEETAQALSRILAYFSHRWRIDKAVLIGYSFGADVLPFAIRRLPPEDRSLVRGVALLGPGLTTDFEFSITDWLGVENEADALPIVPEIAGLAPIPVLCATGKEEDDDGLTACPRLPKGSVRWLQTDGGHHFDGDYKRLTDAVLSMIPESSSH